MIVKKYFIGKIFFLYLYETKTTKRDMWLIYEEGG